MNRFVHVYFVVRAKIGVPKITSLAGAIEAADKMMPEVARRIQFDIGGDVNHERDMVRDATGPLLLQIEDGEETVGYLIDDVEDENYEKSLFLDRDANEQPPNCSLTKAITPQERDTILAALRMWQRCGHEASYDEWIIARGGQDEGKPLDEHAIDALCVRLNC